MHFCIESSSLTRTCAQFPVWCNKPFCPRFHYRRFLPFSSSKWNLTLIDKILFIKHFSFQWISECFKSKQGNTRILKSNHKLELKVKLQNNHKINQQIKAFLHRKVFSSALKESRLCAALCWTGRWFQGHGTAEGSLRYGALWWGPEEASCL